jgi:hypothetical protein
VIACSLTRRLSHRLGSKLEIRRGHGNEWAKVTLELHNTRRGGTTRRFELGDLSRGELRAFATELQALVEF